MNRSPLSPRRLPSITDVGQVAHELDTQLRRHASQDPAAQHLREQLTPLIKKARAGELAPTLRWDEIPGATSFSEGPLGHLPDLEEAYSKFKIAVTGGASLGLNQLKEKMKKQT